MQEDLLKTEELELLQGKFPVEKQEKPPKERAGGSNAGRYSGVKKFCGPAGGAPAGTFPVNTRKRAVAALAYARNAPNPAGIKRCVCRAYPDLPACSKKKAEPIPRTESGVIAGKYPTLDDY